MPIPITADTLNKLADGYAGKAIDAALADINRDMMDRGDDGKVRKLVITITFKPDAEARCKVNVQTKTTLPAYQPPETVAKCDMAAGGFVFNPDLAARPDQLTLNDIGDDEGDDEKPRPRSR